MGTSRKQDDDFLETVLPNSLLELAIDWISSNLDPQFDLDAP